MVRFEQYQTIHQTLCNPYILYMSHEKKPGWLGYIGGEILPSYIGIIIHHYKDPY